MRFWTNLAAAVAVLTAAAMPALAAEPDGNTLVLGTQVAQVPPPPPAPVYNWTGLYLGGNVGGTFGNSDLRTSTIFSPVGYFATTSVPAIAGAGQQKLHPGGFTGGGQIGYNLQIGTWLVGGEIDFQALTVGSTAVTGPTLYPCCAPTAFNIRSRVSADWMATFRPRLGLALGDWLFYGTGGLALTDLSTRFAFTDSFANATESASKSGTQLGWVVGGGVEASLSPQWSLKAEYLHADFGELKVRSNNLTAFTPPIPFPTNTFFHRANFSTEVVRVGLNFHFGAPPPPPPAPMAAPMAPPAAPVVFIVFFDWDKDKITPEGMQIIQQAAAAYKSGAPVQIQITGYTDRSGSPGYNQRLSERRANNVAKAMAALGVPKEQMMVSGKGENDNRVPTADGVREPQNRRVEIVKP